MQTHAAVTLGPLAELNQQLAIEPAVIPDPDVKPDPNPAAPVTATAAKPVPTPAAKPVPASNAKADPKPISVAPRFILNFALVEDDIRYTGENGIRFHRMVVRSLTKPAAEGFDLTPGGPASLDATFDSITISNALNDYLDAYEKHNERFGTATFRSKDTKLNPAHLSIAAWVQDATTHRILQSTIVPLKN